MTLPLLFQFGKRNEKVMPPPVRIIFYIQPPAPRMARVTSY